MPFALILLGLLLIVTGARNTYAQFGAQVVTDATGPRGFLVWMVALVALGLLGYIRDLREFSHYFMALILLAMILSNRGFFQQFSEALAAGPIAPTAGGSQTIASASSGSTNAPNNATSPIDTTPAPGDMGRGYIDQYRPCRQPLLNWLTGPCN